MTKQLQDGLSSMATNLGKKQAMLRYQPELGLTDDIVQLEALWSQNWLAQKICSKKARDMIRRWREITSNDLNAMQLEKIDKVERQLKLKEILEQACVWASLYGGVGILILTDRSTNLPLAPNETIERLVLLKKSLISPLGSPNENLFDENFGKYSFYAINVRIEVHHSRLILLNATPRPLEMSGHQSLWGLSDLEGVASALKRFDSLSINAGDLVQESKTDVFKMDGLSDKIAAGFEEQIAKTVQMVQLIKSSTNTLLLDKENEYEQKELSFSGLKDLLVEFRNAVAGAADMPVTILFGQSVSSLASGDEDIQNYHESIHALQESRLRPVFDRLDPLIANMAIGHFPEDWWFEFVSLTEMTVEQKTNCLNTFASATNSLIQNGVLTEVQVANELKENGLFANISAEDIALLEEQAQEQIENDNADDQLTRVVEDDERSSDNPQIQAGEDE